MNCEEFRSLFDLLLDAEGGRAEMAPARIEELRSHRDGCADCREEIERDRGLVRLLDGLERFRAPSPMPRPRSRAGSLARSGLIAAAASLLVVVGVEALSRHASPGAVGIEEEGQDGWRPLAGGGVTRSVLRSAGERGVLALAGGISLEMGRETRLRVVSAGEVSLLSGWLTARVEPGRRFEVATPLAAVRVKGTVFTVVIHDETGRTKKEQAMNGKLKMAAVAASVSVLVAAGTVAVIHPRGNAEVGPDEAAHIVADSPPEVVKVTKSLADLRASLEELRGELKVLKKGVEAQRGEVTRLAAKVDGRSPGKGTSPEAEPKAPASEEKVSASFDELAHSGYSSYGSPKLDELTGSVRSMGEGGLEFLAGRLEDADAGKRFLAAAVSEKLGDAGMVASLAKAGLGDADPIVRRMATHALAFMNQEEAGDSLVKIIQSEKVDAGVALNAWSGLAKLDRGEAATELARIFDMTGPQLSADLIVESATMLASGPNARAGLRSAYDRKEVSLEMKVKILHVLAQDSSGAYRDFLAQVAADPSVDEKLRKAAGEATR
jgi:FecR-like protein